MKNKKAPGIDSLTRDAMILGREESVKQITKIDQKRICPLNEKKPR